MEPNTEQERIEQLQEDVARLREQQLRMQEAVDAMRSMLIRRMDQDAASQRRLAGRVSHIEHVAEDTAKVLRELTRSRIWKSLRAAGWLILNLVPGAKTESERTTRKKEKKEHIQMRCDSVSADSADPVAGKIEITGWAVAQDGIEKVEIQIGENRSLQVRYGAVRPDIQAMFSEFPDSLHSGFAAAFDTRDAPDGIYRLRIKGFSRQGKIREIELPLIINQEIGVIGEYSRWLDTFEHRDPDLIQVRMAGLLYQPLVSVLIPVYRTGIDILRETIASVKNQSYPHWELCIVDDGSDRPEITALLLREAEQDSRIRFMTRPERGGISAASNDALKMSSGEYIALLDHDDLLSQDALFYCTSELQTAPRPDLLYSDEDHIDESGRRFSPFFKPDWSPDLILSENYVTHLMVFRRDLAVGAGGFRSEFDLSQDHDILLRMSKSAERIVHIPRVLYHWRTTLDSMSRASMAEARAIESSGKVVASFLEGKGTLEEGLYPGRWRARYTVPEGTRVSILIPTAGKLDVLDRNLRALWPTAGYEPLEVVVIDNSKSDQVVKFCDDLRKRGRPVRRFDQRHQPFNYSRLNNLAAAQCDSEALLFLNDDTKGISQGWLLSMLELAVRPEVGAVGAKLIYPDGLIQHAGVTMGLAGICGHSFKGLHAQTRHYYDFPDLIRNVSALTAACLMVRRDVFQQAGGFDEVMFPVAYNDIDLTLKIGAAGYRVLYTPHAQLYHYEAFSKSDADLHPHPAETIALKTKWKEVIARDPFYNPNLTRHIENWSLRWD